MRFNYLSELPSFDPQIYLKTQLYLDLGGQKKKIYLWVTSLPFSNTFFITPYFHCNFECFADGSVNAFNEFGGIAKKYRLDNMSPVVSKVLCGNCLSKRFTFFCNGIAGYSQPHGHFQAVGERIPLRKALEDKSLAVDWSEMADCKIGLFDGDKQNDGKHVSHFSGLVLEGVTKSVSNLAKRLVDFVRQEGREHYNLIMWKSNEDNTKIAIVFRKKDVAQSKDCKVLSSLDCAGLIINEKLPTRPAAHTEIERYQALITNYIERPFNQSIVFDDLMKKFREFLHQGM